MDAAFEAVEHYYVAGLQVRRASWMDAAQNDVRERSLHGGQGGFAGVDASHIREKDSRLSFLSAARRPKWPRAAGSCSSLPSSSLTRRAECATARAAPARQRLSCPRARSAPSRPAGHGPCCRRP